MNDYVFSGGMYIAPLTYTTYTNQSQITVTGPTAPGIHQSKSTQEGNHKMSHNEPSAYEVTLQDGTKVTVADVTHYETSGDFLSFYTTTTDGSYNSKLVEALRSNLVFSFAPVKNPEATVEPKYTYSVVLKDGSTKTVQADLYRVATHGHDSAVQVYEFFTKLPNGGGTREELTIPFEAVQYVERVVADIPAPVASPETPASA